jgi:hypothetical protein
MKNLFESLKNLLNEHTFSLLIVVFVLNIFYNLFYGYNSFIPYGFDEVITIWPIGIQLDRANFFDWFDLLFSRFLSEDHLFPVTNFFTFFIVKLDGNIIDNLYWISRVCYLIILFLSIVLVKNLGFKTPSIICFILVFINSGPINSGLLSFNFNFNLVCIFSLLTLIFYLKSQNSLSNIRRNYFLTLMFAFLGTFTSENFYVIYPIILFLIIYNFKYRFDNLFFALVFFGILVFKFLVSFHYLGVFLPSSRLNVPGVGIIFNSISVVIKVFNNILFGIPLYFFETKNIFSILILLFFFIKLVLFVATKNYKQDLILLFSFLITLPFIGFTGRFHPGLWTFVEILGIAIVSKIFLNQKGLSPYLLFLCAGLFLVGRYVDPFSKLKSFNSESYEISNLAYSLIDVNSQKLLLFDLSTASMPIHPIAFWLGSEIYNKKQGLSFNKKEKSIHMYDMDIEVLSMNKDEVSCILSTPILSKESNLIRTNYGFIHINRSDSIYSEYGILEDYKKNRFQHYDIFNPYFNLRLEDTISVRISTKKFINKKANIRIQNSKIFNLKYLDNEIYFDFISNSFNEKLILSFVDFEISKIFVTGSIPDNLYFDPNMNLKIVSDKDAFFSITNSKAKVIGRIKQEELKVIKSFNCDNSALSTIKFWFFNSENNRWDSYSFSNKLLEENSVLRFKNNQVFLSKEL